MKDKRFTYIEITHFNNCNDCPHRCFHGTDDRFKHDAQRKTYLATDIEEKYNQITEIYNTMKPQLKEWFSTK